MEIPTSPAVLPGFVPPSGVPPAFFAVPHVQNTHVISFANSSENYPDRSDPSHLARESGPLQICPRSMLLSRVRFALAQVAAAS